MSSVRDTARALMERKTLAEFTMGVGQPLRNRFEQMHMAVLLAQARNHIPADKWAAIHDAARAILAKDDPTFDAKRFTAVASTPTPKS